MTIDNDKLDGSIHPIRTRFVSNMFHYDVDSIQAWKLFPCPVLLYCQETHYDKLVEETQTFVHITICRAPIVEKMLFYTAADKVSLPSSRNETKDTVDYLWHTHMKVPCLYKAIQDYLDCEYFAYLDFHAPHELLTDIDTNKYLHELFVKYPHLFINHEKSVYIPGCWSSPTNVEDVDFANHVNWRFCGSFLFGSRVAIDRMYTLYKNCFRAFLDSHNNILSWEVNFWAYLERTRPDEWKPIWYVANHDDSMVRIPDMFSYVLLHSDPSTVCIEYDYPNYSPYRPMSASCAEYKSQLVLNTRFVNYWIYDNGAYYYPEDESVIRTLNVCSTLDRVGETKPLDYAIMKEDCEHVVPSIGCFSEGIEDIRLYISSSSDDLCFIGSTLGYSHNKRITMIQGQYDVETKTCRNMRLIESPYDCWCEKNWAPIPLPSGRDGFIYKWFPLEIGEVVPKEGNDRIGILKIMSSTKTDPWFKQMKGSTPFLPFRGNLLGVVHFSFEKSPRQYFHQLVMINRSTLDIMATSRVFCFRKASVEFCIGFRIHHELFSFWISQMDRDPLYLEVPQNKLW